MGREGLRLCRDGGFGDREDGGARKGRIYRGGEIVVWGSGR